MSSGIATRTDGDVGNAPSRSTGSPFVSASTVGLATSSSVPSTASPLRMLSTRGSSSLHSTTNLSVPKPLCSSLPVLLPYISGMYSMGRAPRRFMFRCAFPAMRGSYVQNATSMPAARSSSRCRVLRRRPIPVPRYSGYTASMWDQWAGRPSFTPLMPYTNPISRSSVSKAPAATPPTFWLI